MRFPDFLVVAFALVVAAPLQAAPALPSWLAGTWGMENGAAWAEEIWTQPRGGMMLGMGRSGFGPDVESWESLRIIRNGDGSLVYVAQPKGGAAVEFPLAVSSGEAIEFANPAHDFPQRIRYWREGQLLMTEISRMDGSGAMRMNFRPVETAPKD